MKNLIVIRAGSTAWEENGSDGAGQTISSDEDRRLQGTVPLPLSEADKKALQEMAYNLRQEFPEIIYHSGNESSGATAACLAELCGLKLKKLDLLHELDCGLWQGLRIKEIKQRYGRAWKQWHEDPASVCPPQGECVTDAHKRVSRALEKIARKNRDKTVIIVAAPFVAALIECIVTDCQLKQLWSCLERTDRMLTFDMQTRNGLAPAESAEPINMSETSDARNA